ncbi:MAG: putative transcriptional regulator, partial [Patescibacteria group bacterium]
MYTLPQEIEVWYIIPAIRRDLSKELVQTHKVSYENTGKLLGLTKSAVSQYIKGKRAAKIKLHPEIASEILKSAQKIFESKSDSVKEILRILRIIKKEGLHCEVCGGLVDGVHVNCKQVVP